MKSSKKLSVIIFLVSIFAFLIVVLVFSIIRWNDGIPSDAYEVVLDSEGKPTGSILVNPKYNILDPASPELYKQPYCQALADSRFVILKNQNDFKQYMDNLLVAADIAEKGGDEEFASTLREGYETAMKTGPKTDEEHFNAGVVYSEIAGTAEEQCGFKLMPYIDPELASKINEKVPPPNPVPLDMSAQDFVEEKGLQNIEPYFKKGGVADLNKGRGVGDVPTLNGVGITYNPEEFKADYCSYFASTFDVINKGGSPELLEKVLLSGFTDVANATAGSDSGEAYASYYENLSVLGFYKNFTYTTGVSVNSTQVANYNASLEKIIPIAFNDCGIDLNLLRF